MEEVKKYPQVPGFSEEELDTFLAKPLLARLSTHNADGTIHTIPIWYEHKNGKLLLSTQTITQKVKNIQRNPQVTVLIDSNTMPYAGVMVVGTAVLDKNNAASKRVSIFERYIGQYGDAYAQQLAAKWEPIIIEVTPNRIISFDYTKGSLVST
ncbi:pyridoxamine 5'-phosphate oxidase family protein [Candidatus Leptofilum sp.]|uniref:pyridoxamine 5'-phosphate oxidase family protein n=1 Tax=Candidatus Leptofilum sp. TaxID=3241576 RepID=UPI003B5B5A20